MLSDGMGRVVQSKPMDSASDSAVVRNRILSLVERDKRNRPMWGKLAAQLGMPKSRGYLSQVASGKRKASNSLRLRLGLHPLHVTVAPLPCGHAELVKRCPICNPPTKYAAHPVMRVSRLRKLLQNPYLQS